MKRRMSHGVVSKMTIYTHNTHRHTHTHTIMHAHTHACMDTHTQTTHMHAPRYTHTYAYMHTLCTYVSVCPYEVYTQLTIVHLPSSISSTGWVYLKHVG